MVELAAQITGVTVFPDRARVVRTGQVAVEAGEQRVVIGPLPLGLLHDSVRVSGRGPVTVLGVDVVTSRREQSEHTHELEEQIRQVEAEQAALLDADAVANARERLLGRVAMRAAGKLADSLGEGVAGFADELDGHLGALYAGRRERERARDELSRRRDALLRRLADLRGGGGPDTLAAEVLVSAGAAGMAEFEVSYVVFGAGWHSSFDVRLDGERVGLTWYGLVSQQTGEDWPECDLKLSTARPAQSLDVPELDPWYLARRQPPPPQVMRPMARTMALPAPMAAQAKLMELDEAPAFEVALSTVEQGQNAATYTPARQVAVPADGTSHRTTVAQFDLEAVLDYVTAPVRAAEATLRATITNSSQHTLPEAAASLFHDGDFVGSTQLELWAPNEERELALGVDDRVRVERELVKRSASKATLGSARRIDAEYEITVANHTPRAIKLTVLDQLPVSRDAQITVRESMARPEPAERSDLGILTWKSEVDAGAKLTVHFGFRVESAKDIDLSGWRD